MSEWELYNCDFRELGDLEERFGEYVIVTDPLLTLATIMASIKTR